MLIVRFILSVNVLVFDAIALFIWASRGHPLGKSCPLDFSQVVFILGPP